MTENPNNLTSPKLPPVGEKREAPHSTSVIPAAGVSRKLKWFVIGLTVITVGAFGIFTALMVKKMSVPKDKPVESSVWGPQLLDVADKLRGAGLVDQALVQYEAFLGHPDIDLKTRAEVSYIVGQLQEQRGNCAEAVSWYFQSQAAFPDAPWTPEMTQRLEGCLLQLKMRG